MVYFVCLTLLIKALSDFTLCLGLSPNAFSIKTLPTGLDARSVKSLSVLTSFLSGSALPKTPL